MSEISTDEIQRGRIEAKIRTLRQEQEKFLQQANQQNAVYAGAIQALEDLLNPEPEPEPQEGEVVDSSAGESAVEAIAA